MSLPMLLEVNAPLWEERSRYGGIFLSRLARWTELTTWLGSDYVLPVTEVLARRVHRAGVPQSKTVVIPNGVSPERFGDHPTSEEMKRRLGLQGRLVLGFAGFVREWHGLERVIECLSRTRNDQGPVRHLLVVGDGPAADRLRGCAKELGVEDRLTITGIVEREEVSSYIAAFDIALQPAVVAYASPLKLFEYMALGRAILAPASANIQEILTHGHDALLFEPDDHGAFEAALDKLCSDPVLRSELGAHAKQLVQDRKLTWANNARQVVALFEGLGVGDRGKHGMDDVHRDAEPGSSGQRKA